MISPPGLIGQKVMSMVKHGDLVKGLSEVTDIRRLLYTFLKLKTVEGPVAEFLRAANAAEPVFNAWREIVAEEIVPENDDDGY